MNCSKCDKQVNTKQTKSGLDRLPRGWKRLGERVLCRGCVQADYVLRAVTFTIASPIDAAGENIPWDEFNKLIREAWVESTRAANWMTTQFYVRDVRREPGMEKLPSMPKVYLYPEARTLFPSLPPTTLASMEQDYKGKYSAKRFGIIWLNNDTLQNYKYPEPFQIPAQGWKASYDDNKRPIVSLPLGGQRIRLRLKGGYRYRRQLAAFARIVSGEAQTGCMAIYRQRTRGQVADGKERSEHGVKVGYRIMVKLVAWFPKREWKERTGTLFVRTDGQSLLVACNEKDDKLWILNADHIRRRVAEQQRQKQRWSEDHKFEQRPKCSFADRRQASSERYQRWTMTQVKEIAAQVVSYARRRHFATIRYNDTDRSYVSQFPYHALQGRIETLCDEFGLFFSSVGGDAEAHAEAESEAER